MIPSAPSTRLMPTRLKKSTAAFTLVEMLVSCTIFVLLMLIVAQIVNSTALVTQGGKKHLDADSQARLALDRIGSDLARMVKRPDVDFFFSNLTNNSPNQGSDRFFFYSETPAYPGSPPAPNQSNTAFVGYRIDTNTYRLERLSKNLGWDNSPASINGSMVYLIPTSATDFTPLQASTIDGLWGPGGTRKTNVTTDSITSDDEPDYSVMGEQIFRLEFCYLLKDGTYSTKPILNTNLTTNTSAPTSTSLPASSTTTGRWYDTAAQRGYICTAATSGAAVWSYLGWQDVTAVIVALAALDAGSQKLLPLSSDSTTAGLPDPAVLKSIADQFPDPQDSDLKPVSATEPPKLMAKIWSDALPGLVANPPASVPKVVAAQIRIYQRTFYLNNP